jgi:hypothetical protein
MILGFDNDDERVFAAHRRFLTEARISTAMVGMLAAIPKTPLHERLAAAGRLDPDDDPAGGTNVLPLNMTRETLAEGYVRLLAELYEPAAYFDRLDDLYIAGAIETERGWRRYAERHPARRWARQARQTLEAAVLSVRVLARVPERRLRQIYRQRLSHLLRRRPDPAVWRVYAIKCAMHFHVHRLIEALRQRKTSVLNTF